MRPNEEKVGTLGEKWKKNAADREKKKLGIMKRGEIKEKEMRQRRLSLEGEEGRRRKGKERQMCSGHSEEEEEEEAKEDTGRKAGQAE